MRTTFNRQLEGLRAELGQMCELAGEAGRQATTAVLDADADAAHVVLDTVTRMRELGAAAERHAVSILALQAPVASDLRMVFAGLRIAAGAERMGGLAAHIAELALLRHPDSAVPADLRETFEAMGRLAVELARDCQNAVLGLDDSLTARVSDGDAAMEKLHRSVFAHVQGPRWSHDTCAAIDVTLLGRYYGRFADQAGEIAQRVVFQNMGHPDGSDAAAS